jgi:hypothetical protein
MTIEDCGCRRTEHFPTVALAVDYAVSYIETVLGYDPSPVLPPASFRMRDAHGELVGFVMLTETRQIRQCIGAGHRVMKEN